MWKGYTVNLTNNLERVNDIHLSLMDNNQQEYEGYIHINMCSYAINKDALASMLDGIFMDQDVDSQVSFAENNSIMIISSNELNFSFSITRS